MNHIELINPYYPGAHIKNFSELDEKLNQYYDYINDYDPVPRDWPTIATPRAVHGDFRSTSRDIFYYISWLYDNNPESVIDFGCGECFWKKWFPNIFGVDITKRPYSKMDLVIHPAQFIANNQNKFNCGMALNSIHFYNLEKVTDNIRKCMTLIKSNGRFLFTINVSMIQDVSHFEEGWKTAITNDLYNNIKNMPYNILLLDIPKQEHRPYINGDIRFILEKD
jgi:hypothetical protein